MCAIRRIPASALAFLAFGLIGAGGLRADEAIRGEQLDPSSYGPSYIESMDEAIERARLAPPKAGEETQRRPGAWLIPTRGATTAPHSGAHNVINKWGDPRIGIGFPGVVDVHGAYFAGQAAEGVWTDGIRVMGYRGGKAVGKTDWFRDLGAEPMWFEMNLKGVDRIEIVAVPVFRGAGFYAMDDLTYSVTADSEETTGKRIVVDFDDLPYKTELTGTGYAGLTWEAGAGEFPETDFIHAPFSPPDEAVSLSSSAQRVRPSGTRATAPTLITSFQGVIRGDAGSFSRPPDTDGAVGPNHYVETVNRVFAVYDKESGAELVSMHLGTFLPGSSGDPRVLFDHHSWRWIIHVTDFDANIFLAVSLSDDPTGDWFKTSFSVRPEPNSSCWPDYPTLGVDANGIYIGVYTVGCDMTIFAIDKAPLVAPSPSLGTITAFRGLTIFGYSYHPAHTYGTPPGEYVLSLGEDKENLHLHRIDPPLTLPTLVDIGEVSVTPFVNPPDADAMGSITPISTIDARLMMSVYRNGSIWSAHTVNVDGRAGVRWYQVDVASRTLVQSGTVAHAVLHYYFPSIMVNQADAVVLGFSGSYYLQYPSCYYTGRLSTDPPGEMANPVVFRFGEAPYNLLDPGGHNRWGDYSYTTLDPVDRATFWTIQEYVHAEDVWGTYIGVLSTGIVDCNNNAVPDHCDRDCGPPGGECDVSRCGMSIDCNLNFIPDECEGDCNGNRVPDECDIAQGTSSDVDASGIPDECEVRPPAIPGGIHGGRKNRYISVSPDNSFALAYQIEMAESAYFPESTGVLGWVGEPDANGVSRVVGEPYFGNAWPDVVHIGDCQIIPVATYRVRSTMDGVIFSDPLMLGTIERPDPWYYGDTVGIGLGQPAPFGFSVPNGIVNVNDVQA
ncbi:MAG: hypothetical protein JSU63_08210, partial [Phycisphaerales bacterium]